MKKIEKFGEWITEYWYLLGAVILLAIPLFESSLKGKDVTLDAKHWECTVAVPKGIETMCTVYNYKGK